MTIKLEVGKKYRNRKGEVKGPLVQVSNGCFQFNYARWYPDGKFNLSAIDCPYDLIEEVIEEPVKKPHKHAELIKAWADGAEIECKEKGNWIRFNNLYHFWNEDAEFRIKPPEVPQWRKDMAEAIKKGHIVEYEDGGHHFETSWTAEDFLNPDVHFNALRYQIRIKPEPKTDESAEIYVERSGCAIYPSQMAKANLKLIWDGETGELKDAEVIK